EHVGVGLQHREVVDAAAGSRRPDVPEVQLVEGAALVTRIGRGGGCGFGSGDLGNARQRKRETHNGAAEQRANDDHGMASGRNVWDSKIVRVSYISAVEAICPFDPSNG